MPLPKGTRYRVKTTKTGKKVRLAFNKSGKVIEAKKLESKKSGKKSARKRKTHQSSTQFNPPRVKVKKAKKKY